MVHGDKASFSQEYSALSVALWVALSHFVSFLK